ncbi:MAG: hypothetical protein JXP39_08825 [Spirochaetales bacterium]|nr:hypothetical protein [Spirochaetales bacterium]
MIKKIVALYNRPAKTTGGFLVRSAGVQTGRGMNPFKSFRNHPERIEISPEPAEETLLDPNSMENSLEH